ncbi:hypothetical protein BLNAU_9560 [Blattamonas nauphoetae]|uniref:Uncharacterized protein n=1 Tax=Blattamonas nauphoetae TaxID=2049346 RepID=A0ABQ9XVK8_9EUKA|nr:hypothetical protein BLNAU_11392 [Blattamonas nauphoetae]KAK2955513.1 hypothetical protein BLNAU_9560 [Blattamonas nauphoetae]
MKHCTSEKERAAHHRKEGNRISSDITIRDQPRTSMRNVKTSVEDSDDSAAFPPLSMAVLSPSTSLSFRPSWPLDTGSLDNSFRRGFWCDCRYETLTDNSDKPGIEGDQESLHTVHPVPQQ